MSTLLQIHHRERNARIYERFGHGELKADLAREYGLSPSRIGGIIEREKQRAWEAQQVIERPWEASDDMPLWYWSEHAAGLGTRARNAFSRSANTLGDLRGWSDVAILSIPNIGKKSLAELRAAATPR